MPALDSAALWNLAVAALGGLAIGVERQQSGHAQGSHARFAGVRTFALIGLGSGLAGWLLTHGAVLVSGVILAGFAALTVAAYVRASGDDVDGTTEVAAIVALAAGTLAGAGLPRLASGVFALTALILVEKHRLHRWVQALDSEDVRAGARFAAMAAVVLPLLPEGPFGPADTIRPRVLWALVLFFSALSFVGVIARRIMGAGRGYVLAGLVGGLLSSTSVTLTYARLSRLHPEAGRALAAGTMGANAVLLPRVLVATSLLAWPLARALWPAFVAPFVMAIGLALAGVRDAGKVDGGAGAVRNPLQFVAALQMAAAFQVVLFAVAAANSWFGEAGLFGSAVVLGLADMDALTVSMADLVLKGTFPMTAATALTIGVLSNTVVKMTIALALGRGPFRWYAASGLAAMGAALAATLLIR